MTVKSKRVPYPLNPYAVQSVRGSFECPNCGETLSPADLESFRICPFCNTVLAHNEELEDYIISPMVEHWVSAINKRFLG